MYSRSPPCECNANSADKETTTLRFYPPEGLSPHEEVIWVRGRKPFGGWILPVVVVLAGGLFIGLGLALPYSAGTCTINNVQRPLSECTAVASPLLIGLGGAVAAGGSVFLFLRMTQYDTRYYLTTFRIVETRRGNVARELSRGLFKGRRLNEFLEKESSYTAGENGDGEDGVARFYTVRVLNPQTGDVALELRDLQKTAVTALDAIVNELYCTYCGRKNSPESRACSNCGASL